MIYTPLNNACRWLSLRYLSGTHVRGNSEFMADALGVSGLR